MSKCERKVVRKFALKTGKLMHRLCLQTEPTILEFGPPQNKFSHSLTPNFTHQISQNATLISTVVAEDLKLFREIQLYKCLQVRGPNFAC